MSAILMNMFIDLFALKKFTLYFFLNIFSMVKTLLNIVVTKIKVFNIKCCHYLLIFIAYLQRGDSVFQKGVICIKNCVFLLVKK